MHPEVAPLARPRGELAIAIAMHSLMYGVEEIPVDFFRCEEEIEIAKSLTAEETIRAAAIVMEALAVNTDSPRVKRAADHLAWTWHAKATAYAFASPGPRVYDRRPQGRQPRARRVRARAGASRDGPSSDDDDDDDVVPDDAPGGAR